MDYHKIKLKPDHVPILKNRGLNWSALAQKPFNLKPTSFTSTIEGLKPKTFSQARQIKWFEEFLDDPLVPRTYCVVSAPNDGQAKLLAAFMMQQALLATNNTTSLPLWVDVYGGFDNPTLQKEARCSLMVINNVGVDSTQPKVEKVRDLLEAYSSIPRIVVATGCDPFQFFTKHLYLPLNSLAYMTNTAIKRLEL